jgi:hypothetical protein
MKFEDLQMIPKISIRFRYNFFHVFRKIGTISILSKYNHFISTNRQKQLNNHFITDFIFIYHFLTGLTPISIINSYETDILYQRPNPDQRYIIPRPNPDQRYTIPNGKKWYETDTYIEIEPFF